MTANIDVSEAAPLFVSRRQVAQQLGVDPTTIDRWAREGTFVPKVRMNPPRGRVAFSKAAFDEWIARRNSAAP